MAASRALSDVDSESSFKSVDDILSEGTLLEKREAFDGIPMALYSFDARRICQHLDVWAFNRVVNEEHVNNMHLNLLKQKHPHFMGTIKAIMDNDNDTLQITDGQHRLHVMNKYFNGDVEVKDFKVLVEVYHVPSIDDPIVFELYRIANLNLNVKMEDDVNMFLAQVVNALAADPSLSKGIVDRNIGKVNKPRIAKKQLYEHFKEHFKTKDMKLSVDDIVNRVKALNVMIYEKPHSEVYGRKDPAEKHRIQRARAENYRFYLNMNGRFGPEKWIPMIGSIEMPQK